MQNVYDELVERGLIHIISDNQLECEIPKSVYKNAAVAVNLFYEDTVQKYFTYLNNIPKEIEVFIYSSNKKTADAIARYADMRSNTYFWKKENRGRDISAFLVSFRETALKKKFLCFLHDKKEKCPYYQKDTDYWIENLWGNTVCSETYVNNILNILDKTQAGILAPPIPFGERFPYWYTNQWSDKDFEIAEELADMLGLKCDMDKEKMPITLGSVFWCKTEAIKKILSYSWKYEDFVDEPMPDDGTVSHAIERIFGYICQDAGYTTEWVMCPKYAGTLILKTHRQMQETYSILRTNAVAGDFTALRRFAGSRKRTEEFCAECGRIYLYGAGVIGQEFAGWMYRWGLRADGFVVTKKNIGQRNILEIPVYELDEIAADETMGIIITAGFKFCREIETIIKKKGITRYMKLDEDMEDKKNA